MATLILAALIGWAVPGCSLRGLTVRTSAGLVQAELESDVAVFKGVPFAQPPVGLLRWRAPQPLAPWAGVLHANAFRPMCMASTPAIPGQNMEQVSEDCLYLNIWAPAGPPAQLLPVMVFIYGGGFRTGSASSPVYWGNRLVEKGVITVNLSYRGGSFGFLAHPDLSQESGYSASGNYGLMDLIAGLRWVKLNIAAFGGDPGRVTIVGQSAGSMAVGYLMTTPLAKGLFQRAIGQSGADMNPVGVGMMQLPDAEASGLRLQERLGARSLAEMRRVPAEQILAMDAQWPMDAQGAVKRGTMAVLDGHVFSQTMYDTFAQGKQNDVPLLIGYNADEGATFLTRPLSGAAFSDAVRQQYHALAEQILQVYPAVPEESSLHSQRRLLRDNWYAWHVWTWARLQSRTGRGEVYFYNFSHVTRFPEGSPMKGLGAAHGFELMYTFGHADYLPQGASDEDRAMVEAVSAYWTNFAKAGKPGGLGLPSWPRFTEADPRIMNLGNPFQARLMEAIDLRGLQLQDEHVANLRD